MGDPLIRYRPDPHSAEVEASFSRVLDVAMGRTSGAMLVRGAAAWCASETTGSKEWTWQLGLGADVATGTDLTVRGIAMGAGTFVAVRLNAKTGPVGDDLVIDLRKSSDGGSTWTSLWASTPASMPTIFDGATNGVTTAFDTTAYGAGDLIRLDVASSPAGVQGVAVALLGRMTG